MKYLDTTVEIIEYSDDLIYQYNYYFFKLRKKYLRLIDRNFYKKPNLDILTSSIAEKNISNSHVYHNLCLYFSILNIVKKKNVKEIIVNNLFLKNILQKKLKKKIIIIKKKNNFDNIVKFIKVSVKHICVHIISKLLHNKRKLFSNITIVDRFVTDENPNVDRYYNNFFSNKRDVYQVPTFVNLSLKQIIIFLIKSRKKKFILKSDYLDLKDIYFSLMFFFRSKKINYKKINLENLDISHLINDEFNKVFNFNASVIGIQNYLFAKKMKQNNLKIYKIINWNENSIVDKGWNLGFRTFFPKNKTYGYQNYFVEKKFSSLDITSFESKLKSSPEYLLIISKNVKKARKEFTKNLKFIDVRALRFDYLFNQKIFKSKFNNKIVILLNLNINDNFKIINKILKTKFSMNGNKIFIKEHPLLNLQSFYKKKLPNNWEIIKGEFKEVIKKFKVVIATGSTSSVFESIALGGKVIFPLNNYYDRFNLELLKVPKNSYKVCQKIEDLDKSIQEILNQKINNFMYYNNKNRLKKLINKNKYLI